MQLLLKVGPQQIVLRLPQHQRRRRVLRGHKLRIQIQQLKAVRGWLVRLPVVVGKLQLLPRLHLLAHPHQVDPQLRPRPPIPRVRSHRLAIVRNSLRIPPVQHQMPRHNHIASAVYRIHGLDLRQPGLRVRILVLQQVRGRVQRHRVQFVRRQRQRRIRLLHGCLDLLVLQVQVRHERMRLCQVRVGRNRLRRILPRNDGKAVRAHHRQPQVGLRIPRLQLQRLVEQVRGVGVVKTLMQQHAPAYLHHRLSARLRRCGAECVVRLLP